MNLIICRVEVGVSIQKGRARRVDSDCVQSHVIRVVVLRRSQNCVRISPGKNVVFISRIPNLSPTGQGIGSEGSIVENIYATRRDGLVVRIVKRHSSCMSVLWRSLEVAGIKGVPRCCVAQSPCEGRMKAGQTDLGLVRGAIVSDIE